MAIVKMKKFKLFALEKDRKAFIKRVTKNFDYVPFHQKPQMKKMNI